MKTVRDLMNVNSDWLKTLQDVYKIKASAEGDLVSLKYNQLESPMHEPIVAQCRGMVVDVKRGTILAHPYDKFWNHGEEHAAPIDWSTARVQEKLDGSLMILWWSPTALEWRVSSSGHPTAGGDFGYDTSRKFADAFWSTFHASGMSMPTASHVCFMFELCAKENRIVVKHDAPKLVLHGARDMETDGEIARADLETLAALWRWEIVKEYPIGTIEDALVAVEALDPMQSEGFVVVDAQFRRVKIKSPRYVLLHHMRGDGMSTRRGVELWLSGETAEVIANFPEFTPEVDAVTAKIEQSIAEGFNAWNDNRSAPSRKDFALAVKDTRGAWIAFKLWTMTEPTTDDARAILRDMTTPAILRLIEALP